MMARLVAAAVGVALLAYVAAVVLSILAIGITLYGLFYVGRALWRAHRAAGTQRRHRRAELLARAEIQHRWYVAGDPRGTYGRYPPTGAS